MRTLAQYPRAVAQAAEAHEPTESRSSLTSSRRGFTPIGTGARIGVICNSLMKMNENYREAKRRPGSELLKRSSTMTRANAAASAVGAIYL